MLREDDWTKPRRPQRLKRRAEPWTCMTSCRHARPTRGWPAVVGAHSGRVARRTPTGNARRQCVWRFSVRRRPGKIKDKERRNWAEHREWLLIVLMVAKRRLGTIQRPAVKRRDSEKKTRTLWYNGDIRKTRANGFDLNISKHYQNYSQTERLFDKRYGWIKRQTREKNKEKKKSKWLCNNLGSNNVRSQFKPTATRSFAILTPQNARNLTKWKNKNNSGHIISWKGMNMALYADSIVIKKSVSTG